MCVRGGGGVERDWRSEQQLYGNFIRSTCRITVRTVRTCQLERVALAKGAGSLVCGLRNALDGDDDDDDDGGGCARGRLIRVKLLIKYQFISANSKHTHNQPPIKPASNPQMWSFVWTLAETFLFQLEHLAAMSNLMAALISIWFGFRFGGKMRQVCWDVCGSPFCSRNFKTDWIGRF